MAGWCKVVRRVALRCRVPLVPGVHLAGSPTPAGFPAVRTELRAAGVGRGPSPTVASVTGGGEALGAGAPI